IAGPQPPAGEQVTGLLLRDPDLNPCLSHDYVITECFSSCALTAPSTTARHSPMPPRRSLSTPRGHLGRSMCSGDEADHPAPPGRHGLPAHRPRRITPL